MRIGIITHWTSNNNYGELLQCWALQHFLKEKAYDPFLIRYLLFKESNQPFFSKARLKYLVKKIRRPIYRLRKSYKLKQRERELDRLFEKKDIIRGFDSFRNDFLSCSPRIYKNYSEIRRNPPEADVYITGSDQVWNFDIPLSDTKAFFLQFGDKDIKRISYAPSIAHDYWPEDRKNELHDYLASFNAISVRESSGVGICKSVGFDAIYVVDPTLLLTQKDYDSIKDKSLPANPYIYIYSMNYKKADDIQIDDIRDYSVKKNLLIKVTNGTGYVPCRELFDGVEYEYSTIPQWLNNIANATLVVTPSFHGIVFSILFHTNFVYTPLKGRHSQGNTRILDLLKTLNLECMIEEDGKSIEEYVKQSVDWEYVDKILNVYREKSIEYLINALQ